MYETIDLPLSGQQIIKNIVTSHYFPWYYNQNTVGYDTQHQFIHNLVPEGTPVGENANTIINQFNFLSEFKTHKLKRAKLNLNVSQKKRSALLPHVDNEDERSISLIYYVIDSDGPTVLWPNQFLNDIRFDVRDVLKDSLFARKRIHPKQGRMVKFPSNMIHSANIPHNFNKRIVLNMVFVPR